MPRCGPEWTPNWVFDGFEKSTFGYSGQLGSNARVCNYRREWDLDLDVFIEKNTQLFVLNCDAEIWTGGKDLKLESRQF